MAKKATTRKERKGGKRHAATPVDPPALDKSEETETIEAIALEFPGPTPEFAGSREFFEALAQKCNLVGVGSALLQGKESKNASVRARMFETTLEYLYGKPPAAPAAEAPVVQIIWDMPGPDRERIPE